MTERLDQVEVGLAEKIENASVLLNAAAELAETIRIDSAHSRTDELIDNYGDAIVTISSGLSAEPDLLYTFSGNGLGVFIDEDNDLDTGYLQLNSQTGRFNGLYIEEFDIFDYRTIDQDDIEEAVAEGRGHEVLHLSKLLLSPPEGPRLMVEFLIDRSNEIQKVRGSALRSLGVEQVSIVDMLGVQIELIDEPANSRNVIRANEFQMDINHKAMLFCDELHDPKFYKKTAAQQSRFIDAKLYELNAAAQVQRFKVLINPGIIYSPVIKNDQPAFSRWEDEDQGQLISVKLKTLDVLDTVRLHSGRGIRNPADMIEPAAGFCLVGEVDERTRKELGLPSKIVWVPVNNQGFNLIVEPKDIEKL